jgi:hypothetical protein
MSEVTTWSARQLGIAVIITIAVLLAVTAFYAGAYAALVMRGVK